MTANEPAPEVEALRAEVQLLRNQMADLTVELERVRKQMRRRVEVLNAKISALEDPQGS